jgi:hypothetical protein
MNVPSEVIVPSSKSSLREGCEDTSACIQIFPSAEVHFADKDFVPLPTDKPVVIGSLDDTYFVVTVTNNPFKGFNLKITRVDFVIDPPDNYYSMDINNFFVKDELLKKDEANPEDRYGVTY